MQSDTKAIATVKTQVSKAIQSAQAVAITDKESLEGAADVLSKIKGVMKLIAERMEGPVKTAYQAYKSIKAQQEQTWGPFLNECTQAEAIIKEKMLAFYTEEDRKAKEAEAKILADRRMKAETKVERMAQVETPQTNVKGDTGAVTFREVPDIEIVDASKIPMQYYDLNYTRIRKDVLVGVEVPGVKKVMKKVVASKAA